jgi:hypothetical protein
MSDDPELWYMPTIVLVRRALDDARAHYDQAGHREYLDLAAAYRVVIDETLPQLRTWKPAGEFVTMFVRTGASVEALLAQRNYPGVLHQTYEILSRLPGDPSKRPRKIPPVPGQIRS